MTGYDVTVTGRSRDTAEESSCGGEVKCQSDSCYYEMRCVQSIVVVVVICTAWSVHTVNRPSDAHRITTPGNKICVHLSDKYCDSTNYLSTPEDSIYLLLAGYV